MQVVGVVAGARGGLRRWRPRRPRRPRDGEDGDGGSGHPVLRRGGPRLPGGLNWRMGARRWWRSGSRGRNRPTAERRKRARRWRLEDPWDPILEEGKVEGEGEVVWCLAAAGGTLL